VIPVEWTNRPDPNGILYGNYIGHVANESAIRSYSYPPPVSFTYLFDDGSWEVSWRLYKRRDDRQLDQQKSVPLSARKSDGLHLGREDVH
jgi:hypothetical protein